ncbi:MAG: ATP-binding cassette domain-containing protein [Termitinemataceae bacterium]|nr:MAG: ATP-binding cassette domain-containing protein [Termitinemataceae bacterium]
MIEVSNLVKTYGQFNAVKDVSFKVESDQVLGFLGPNGAGKTTIMKILTGYHFPTSGEAYVNGLSVLENPLEVKKLIGYLPESVPLYGELTVDEYLNFAADARGIEKGQRAAKVNAALHSCGLTHMRGKRIEALSKGYKQRTGLAQAILHDPQILILDEPTTGLDPNQIIEIRALIKELGKSKTVILSTHILQEVEAVCTSVLILNEGSIAAQGTADQIAGEMRGGETWLLSLKCGNGQPPLAIDSVTAALQTLGANIDGSMEVQSVENEADTGIVNASFFIKETFSNSQNMSGEKIFDWAIANSFKILQMNTKRISLEDIFVKLTNESSSNAAASLQANGNVEEGV